jgi:sugar phosphate isomerase/epimerase
VHLPDLNDQIFKALEITKNLEAEKAIIHFFTYPQGDFHTKIINLRRLCKQAEDSEIQLCLENTAENVRLMEILFETLPRIKFCLDIGHANLWRNRVIDFIDVFASRLTHIHIHDNNGGFSMDSDVHLAPGEGNIDFPLIFRALEKIQYSELLTFERTPWDNNERIIGVMDNIQK